MDLDFTGERLIPTKPELRHLYQEHIVRYMFATQFTKSKSVLDAGCGVGYGSFLFSTKGAKKVVGVDIDEKTIEYCKSNYKAKNLEFVNADCTQFNMENSSFDVIVSFEVIEHLKSVELFLSEVKKILKKNGCLIVSTPNKITYPSGNPFHIVEYTEEEFRTLLKKYFSHVQILYQNYPPTMAIYGDKKIERIDEVNPSSKETGVDDTILYFIAICSDKAIKNYVNTIFLFNDKTIILEEYLITKKRITKLERDLRLKEQELSVLQSELKQYRDIESSDSINELKKENENIKNQLNGVLLRLDNLYQSFSDKTMFSYNQEVLDKAYRELLKRPPDEIALNYYLSKLQDNQISEEELRNTIMQSEEYKNLQL